MKPRKTLTHSEFADFALASICKTCEEIRTELLKEPSVIELNLSDDEKGVLEKEIGIKLMWKAYHRLPEGQAILDRIHDRWIWGGSFYQYPPHENSPFLNGSDRFQSGRILAAITGKLVYYRSCKR